MHQHQTHHSSSLAISQPPPSHLHNNSLSILLNSPLPPCTAIYTPLLHQTQENLRSLTQDVSGPERQREAKCAQQHGIHHTLLTSNTSTCMLKRYRYRRNIHTPQLLEARPYASQ